MSAAQTRLRQLQGVARKRVAAAELLLSGPLGLAVGYATLRWFGPTVAAGTIVAAAMLLAWRSWRGTRRIDLAWVTRRLDAAAPTLEDSSALLIHAGDLGRLERLQRERVAERLVAGLTPDLRPAWPARTIGAAWLCAVVILAISSLWDGSAPDDSPDPGQAATPMITDAAQTRITAAALEITPPAYTGLDTVSEQRLDARAPEGSALTWRLRFDPQPAAVHLATHDGERIPLHRDAGDWRAQHVLQRSMLYRVVVSGAPPVDARLHRLDAITDQAPRIRVIAPDQNVVYAEAGQSRWPLVFEVDDDYGLGDAWLLLTLAQGSGELVDFVDLRRAIDGAGDARQRRYSAVLELDEIGVGVGPGDDLVARLEIADNRAPDMQVSRSASVVLRWPPPVMGDVAGFDDLMQRTLPAYFRSQRQIILDTERLVAEDGNMPVAEFVAHSNAIGVDQQLLRLRYGQFMGEEAESGEPGSGHDDHDHAEPAPEVARRPAARNPLFADDAGQADEHGTEASRDDHAPVAGFGEAGDLTSQYGHLHDIPEAATLLDPQTRELLRGALRAMWDAEGFLRVGEPASALPHENRALELIKEVQRADRVYLARVGLELPPIDASRRMSGDIEGVTDRVDSLQPAEATAGPLQALWRDLQDWHGGTRDAAGLESASRWILDHQASLDDPLGLIAAIDALQRDPACENCRERLQDALWPALPVPPAGVMPRARIDAAGARYLEALGTGDGQ